MTTIHEVALRAGVSAATVSHVINGTRFVSDEARQRVTAAMDELDYRPNTLARSLRRGRTQTIGLILPDSSNPFFAEIAHGIEQAAFARGYNVILCNTDGNIHKERLYLHLLADKQVDGVLLDTEAHDPQALRSYLPAHLPVVLVDRDFADNPFDVVLADSLQGAQEAVAYLIGQGHRRIACMSGPQNLLSAAQRREGYSHTMNQAGLEIRPEWIYPGAFRPDVGRQGARQLLKLQPAPTAIFACNDMLAIGALRAATDLGLHVPDDFSVVGFDDVEMASFTSPTLTTIAQPKQEISRRAVERLIQKIGAPAEGGVRELVPTRLILRESTGLVKVDINKPSLYS